MLGAIGFNVTFLLLQPLPWRWAECAVHHERNVGEEQHHIYMTWTSNHEVISSGDLYCCLLPQCEALRTCRSGFPIATLPLRPYYKKISRPTCFSKDEESLTTFGCVLWCSRIVCIRPYSFNTTTTFYFMNECSNIAVSLWLKARRVTTHSHVTWTRPLKGLAPWSA